MRPSTAVELNTLKACKKIILRHSIRCHGTMAINGTRHNRVVAALLGREANTDRRQGRDRRTLREFQFRE
jgi:hypothetical protein